MSKKKKKPAATGSVAENQRQQKNKLNGFGGIVIGVVVALVIFSFSGMSKSNVNKWTESVGKVVSAYTITEEENKDEAGIYADIEFVDNTGTTRTERSTALKSELTDYVGKTMEIKYNPKGEGVAVAGFEAASKTTPIQFAISMALVIVVFIVGELIKKAMPTPEEYKQRHPKKK